jgi:uncharacterized protein (DUF2147 family)
MTQKILSLAACLALCLGATPLVYAQASPAGVWKTIDDKTGKERSMVRIADNAGTFSGKIEKLLAPDAKQDAVCDKCDDDRKDKPVLGMEILRGVKSDGDNTWAGGTILDAAEGKIYKVRLQLAEGGKKLEVRGYVGAPMFGRTQTWIRAE